jgi:curved DNA-binding protein CbpA
MRQRVTLYETLGVERDSTEQDIRAAFRGLAFKYHPDRFALGDQRTRAEAKFQEITEAFNVLCHPEAREKYDKEIAQGTASNAMDRQEIARRLTAKGSQALRSGNMAEALEDLKMAVDHDDDFSRGHYFYGLALGRIQGRERDALRHLERATVLEPDNATIKAEAASLALAAGMKSRALRHAQQALDIDPTNEKASKVRDQVEGSDKPQVEGLLDRLRRRG